MKKLITILFLFQFAIAFNQVQTINVGTTANDGTGDNLRSAFQKTNSNFSYLNAIKLDSADVKEKISDSLTVARAQLRSDISDSISNISPSYSYNRDSVYAYEVDSSLARLSDLPDSTWESITVTDKVFFNELQFSNVTNPFTISGNSSIMEIAAFSSFMSIDDSDYFTLHLTGNDVFRIFDDNVFFEGLESFKIGYTSYYDLFVVDRFNDTSYTHLPLTIGNFINEAGTEADDQSRLYVNDIYSTSNDGVRVRKEAWRHLRATAYDSVVTIDIAAQNVWYQVTNLSDSLFRYVEANNQFLVRGDTIIYNDATISSAHYDWGVMIGGEGSTSIEYSLRIYNVTDGYVIGQVTKEFGADANYDNITFFGYDISADNGDKVVIQVRNNEGTQDFIFKQGFIKVDYNHE